MKVGKLLYTIALSLFILISQRSFADESFGKRDDELMDPRYSHSLAFSPDGLYAVLSYEDKTLKLWELSSGKRIRIFKGHTDAVVSVAFSPEGHYILSGSMDHTMKLWDTSSGKEVRTFMGHSGTVASVVFSQNGRYALSGSEDRNMKLWEVSSGREIRSFKGHEGYIGSAVAFSPNNQYVLMGNTLWNRFSGKEIRVFKSSGKDGYWKDSVKFSLDGKYVWIGETFMEVATGKALLVLTGLHGSTLHSIFAYSPDGRFVVSGGGTSAYGITNFWNISAFLSLGTAFHQTIHLMPESSMTSEKFPVIAIAISPDSRFVLVRTLYITGSNSDTLTLWNINDMNKPVRTFMAR